jgi:hypothetical protein
MTASNVLKKRSGFGDGVRRVAEAVRATKMTRRPRRTGSYQQSVAIDQSIRIQAFFTFVASLLRAFTTPP